MKSLRRNRLRLLKILDPEGSFLNKWNKLVLLSCLSAVCVDPLLSYISVIDDSRLCLFLDKKLAITFCFLRTFVDAFYLLHILLRFFTGFFSPTSRVSVGGALVTDLRSIAERYLQSYFIMDALSILPLPQVATVIAFQAKTSPFKIRAVATLTVLQNLVRVARILPLVMKVTRTSAISTPWSGAASNFFLYMLASHVISTPSS